MLSTTPGTRCIDEKKEGRHVDKVESFGISVIGGCHSPSIAGATVVLSAIAVALLSGRSSCSTICAGQCSAPDELEVSFHLGTTPHASQAALTACGHNSIVTR